MAYNNGVKMKTEYVVNLVAFVVKNKTSFFSLSIEDLYFYKRNLDGDNTNLKNKSYNLKGSSTVSFKSDLCMLFQNFNFHL